MELVCRPVMWKHDQAIDHSEKNVLKFIVESLPNGIFAEITRKGEKWRYEITIGGAQPIQSEALFNTVEDAKTAIAEWLSNRPKARPIVRASRSQGDKNERDNGTE